MTRRILAKEIESLLESNEFINISTCGPDMQPNVAPKIILKIEKGSIYLGDYNIDRTFMNIYFNHKVSLSIMNLDTLVSYQINGLAETIDQGRTQDKLSKLFNKKKMYFSINRVIDGVRSGKKHEAFEMTFPERVIVYKIKIEEIIEIRPSGTLERR